MCKTFGAALLLAVLLMPLSEKAVASPPAAISARMVDEVAKGLSRYRAEADPVERARLLRKLAPYHDPRVAVALGEALDGDWLVVEVAAVYKLALLYMPPIPDDDYDTYRGNVRKWWNENASYLRLRARELPR